jgi:AcrR family transcriptional regulator
MTSIDATTGSIHDQTSTAARIIAAARSLAARGGVSAISMGDVAAEARVSKALIHYHFQDKSTLLRALVDALGSRIASRSRIQATAGDAHVLDTLWSWLVTELDAGDIRVLISLAECDDESVRGAVRRVADDRRRAATEHVDLVFAQLGLRPRIHHELVAETLLSFVDGLATRHALTPEREPRPAFDVLWLALLTLAE